MSIYIFLIVTLEISLIQSTIAVSGAKYASEDHRMVFSPKERKEMSVVFELGFDPTTTSLVEDGLVLLVKAYLQSLLKSYTSTVGREQNPLCWL